MLKNVNQWRLAGLSGLAVAALALTGCPPTPPNGDAGVDAGDGNQCPIKANGEPAAQCQKNIDCGGGEVCDKAEDDDLGCCIKVVCTADADCTAPEECNELSGLCGVPVCDPANPGAVCQPGDVCTLVNGASQCVSAAELPTPSSCQIDPNPVIAHAGKPVELHAVGFAQNGNLVPFAQFNFSADGSLGTIANSQLTGTCAGPAVCKGTVTAQDQTGSATCTSSVSVYPAVAAGSTRVVVVDQITNKPISGVKVAARIANALQEGTTDADGAFTFTGDATAVSAFPDAYQWQSVVQAGTNDVVLYTTPLADPTKVAGVKGKFNFDNVSTQGDIKVGLGGTSISSSFTDLNFSTIVGEIANYSVDIDGVTDGPTDAPLPSGLSLSVGSTTVKDDFVVFGDPGKRVLWALGGKVRLADLGPIISSVTASDDINVGQIFGAVLPFFVKFDHAVVSNLDLTLQNRPASLGEDVATPYASWPFKALDGTDGPAVDINTPLGLSTTYTLPTLPCAPGKGQAPNCADKAFVSGAVLLSGTFVPGVGLVPLGLTAGLDDFDDQDAQDLRDGKIDYAPGTAGNPNKGDSIIGYAPAHDGLEGNPLITIAIALDINSLSGGELGASLVSHVTNSYSGAGNTFPVGSFVENQGGTYSAGAGTFALSPVGNADFYRINLSDGDDTGDWNVYFGSNAGTITLSDLRPSSVTGRTGNADVQAFRLGTGYAGLKPASYKDVFEFNGTNLRDFVLYLGAFSSQACEAGSVCNAQ